MVLYFVVVVVVEAWWHAIWQQQLLLLLLRRYACLWRRWESIRDFLGRLLPRGGSEGACGFFLKASGTRMPAVTPLSTLGTLVTSFGDPVNDARAR
jgi:hypothetical protein